MATNNELAADRYCLELDIEAIPIPMRESNADARPTGPLCPGLVLVFLDNEHVVSVIAIHGGRVGSHISTPRWWMIAISFGFKFQQHTQARREERNGFLEPLGGQ
jgi:hypothetical protein